MNSRPMWMIALVAMAVASARAAIITNYYYGSTDNSALYGVTPAGSYSQGSQWKDTAIRQNDSHLTYGQDTENTVSERRNIPATARYNTLVSFGNLTGISSSANVFSAYFHFYVTDWSSIVADWTIYGISAADKNWSEAVSGANYTTKDGSTPWIGSNFENSLVTNGNYGTFSIAGAGNKSIDVTQAIKDYVDGTIGGIVFTRQTGTRGTGVSFVWAMDENGTAAYRPGLSVGVIPEPAAISLIAFVGGLSLFVYRRFFSGGNGK